MDWNRAITRNRDALQRIVAALFAMLRTPGDSDLSKVTVHDLGEGTFTLPRHIYAAILLILRPAESALRRLIIIAAQGLVLKSRLPRPLPSHLPAFPSNSALKTPAFALFDPLKRFSIDDFDTNDLPQFNLCYGDEGTFHTHQLIASDKPVNAAQLYARLRALRHALSDLPRQARRLARWQARRDLALKSKAPFKPMRLSIFRPGLPPGWRQRSIHEIDEVLRECHGLALYAVNGPDTG